MSIELDLPKKIYTFCEHNDTYFSFYSTLEACEKQAQQVAKELRTIPRFAEAKGRPLVHIMSYELDKEFSRQLIMTIFS